MPLYQVNAGDRILAVDINQFYNFLKGVAASGESATLIYNGTALIFQPSSDPSAGTRVLDIKNAAGTHLASVDFNGVLEMLAAAAAPTGAVAGAAYFDTVLTALRVYDGTAWIDEGLIPGRWAWSWLPGMAIQSDLTGTGSFANTTATIDSFVALATGATSGSLSGIRKQLRANSGVAGTNGVGKVRRWEFSFYSDINANTNAFVFLTDENAATAPSLTARHLGIKQVGAVVSFSTADNTTEQTTDVSAFFTTQQVRVC